MLDALLPSAPAQAAASPGIGPTIGAPACPPWLTPVRDLQFARRTGTVRRDSGGKVEGSAARAEGKRFERRVTAALLERFPFLLVEPGFRFRDRFGERTCYPDAVLRFNDRTVVVEIKARGTQVGDAWWQLERYYRPVVEATFPSDPVFTVAIVRRLDPMAFASFTTRPVETLRLDEPPPAPFTVMEWSSLQ